MTNAIEIISIDYNITLFDHDDHSYENRDGYMFEAYRLNIQGKPVKVEFMYDDVYDDDPQWNRISAPSVVNVTCDHRTVTIYHFSKNDLVLWDVWNELSKLTAHLTSKTEIPCNVNVRNLNWWDDDWHYYNSKFVMTRETVEAWEEAHAC